MIRPVLISLGLVVITLAVYAPVGEFLFIQYDDPLYVSENPYVREGLTARSIRFALSDTMGNYWHPTTTLAHIAVGHLYGLNPAAHHWVNVILHAVNAALVFVLLRHLTRATWRSAAVAALFAWHPLRVESVAWVTELSTMLCVLMLLLGTAAYVAFARRSGWTAWLAYLGVAACLVAALTSKPVALTFPFVLLLLDLWPLDRLSLLSQNAAPLGPATAAQQWWGRRAVVRLLLEKVPLLAIVAAFMAAALLRHAQAGGFESTGRHPLPARLGNAVVSYIHHLRMTIWPSGLSPSYPHLPSPAIWQALLATLLLLGITGWALVRWRRHPYLTVGWLWFVGTLAPMSGLIQLREATIADRYSYFPHIGLFIAVVWGAAALLPRTSTARSGLTAATITVALALLVGTRLQVRHWKDTFTLFSHALAVNETNYIAHNQVGLVHLKENRPLEALQHFKAAVELQPRFVMAVNNVGITLLELGRIDEAIVRLEVAVKLDLEDWKAHQNLGNGLMAAGRTDEAIRCYRTAIQLNPRAASAHHNLAAALAGRGELEEAIRLDGRAVQLEPQYPEAYYSLGLAQAMAGHPFSQAAENLRRAAMLRPKWSEPRMRLAWLLATHRDANVRNGREAVAFAEQAVQLRGATDPEALDTLAAAYAEAGRFEEAIRTGEAALRMAKAAGAGQLTADIERRLVGYRSGRTVAMMRGSRAAGGPAGAVPATTATAPATAPTVVR